MELNAPSTRLDGRAMEQKRPSMAFRARSVTFRARSPPRRLGLARAPVGIEQLQQPGFLRQYQADANAVLRRERGVAGQQRIELARDFLQPLPHLLHAVDAQAAAEQQQCVLLAIE